jgi:phytoene dehydrogenase-like protein
VAGDADAIVVGSGPNGLAAAVTLAAAGLRVQVIEGAAGPGGGCRTEELTLPGFRHDVCSAAHPLALASPFFRRFGPAARGVRFAHPEVVYAHPLDGRRAAVVTRSVADTASLLGRDASAYRRLMQPLSDGGNAVADAVLSSMRRPPRYSGALASYARLALRSAAAVADRFHTDEARGLLAGAAAHAMLPLTEPPSAGVALLLGSLAHTVGWPVVAGGSGRLTDAMIDAIIGAGGQVETGRWVRSLADLPRAPATLLDVSPRAFLAMTGERLPTRYRDALAGFRYGPGICKVDFALSGPVPWQNDAARQAGTLHLGGGFEEIAAAEAAVARGEHPDSPYVLVVQACVADPDRAPRDRHTLWAYCHVPPGSTVDMTARIEAQIERFAPGFTDLVLARHTRTAAQEEAENPNYVGGDIACGRQTVRQVLARPAIRWNPYRTPLRGVYLCSSATPPGPGVHGRCGELAALAALRGVFGVREPPDLAAGLPGLPRRGPAYSATQSVMIAGPASPGGGRSRRLAGPGGSGPDRNRPRSSASTVTVSWG